MVYMVMVYGVYGRNVTIVDIFFSVKILPQNLIIIVDKIIR